MTIATLFGGSSYEHEISIVSAITLKKVLKSINTIFIFVDSAREFYLIEPNKMKSKTFSSGEYKKCKRLIIDKGGFYQKGFLGSRRALEFDVVLNLIHGRDGEDGKIAGVLEFFQIPFIGPRVDASVFSYNKLYTKLLAKYLNINVLDYRLLNRDSKREIDLDFPVIVKPVRLGSSIGVSVANSKDELDYALDVAFEFDEDVIIEPFIKGIKEYNLAGAKAKEWRLSLIEEPQKGEMLDFEKKYMDFSRDERVKEANLNQDLKNQIIANFKKIYEPLFLGSLIRCDFFVIDDRIYLNEINPIPGSMANYLFDDFEALLRDLATSLPKEQNINIDYRYIDTIQKAKGKA